MTITVCMGMKPMNDMSPADALDRAWPGVQHIVVDEQKGS